MATLSNHTPRKETILRLVPTGRTNKVFAAQIRLAKNCLLSPHKIYIRIIYEHA